jgi:outer membrane protein TolC
MNARVQSGTALPADAALIEATLLQRQQDFAELRANHSAAVARLATMVRRPLPRSAVMVLPDLNAPVATARQQFQTPRARPEYEQFARTRERIAKQSDLTAAQSRPKLSAFGRAGYGRPGLDFIANEWQVYGVGGFRLQWNAWTWGSTGRERQASSLEQQITDADEAAFTQNLSENTENDVATIDRLMAALDLDDRIIALRTDVLRSVQVRLQEGVVTVSDYLARNAELLQARIALAAHQVELAQANAKFLTTLGLEVR